MPSIIKYYVKTIDFISLKTGRATMYLVFVMMFILILSFVTRNIINIPLIWIIEMAQFVMTGYYLLGGGYSMLTDDHVRMDLFYGSITSLQYTIQTKQKLFTAWAPYVWPIKSLMLIGILLMLLQAFSMLFKDIAKIKGKKI